METLGTPVAPGFFPQVVLTVEELMHYRRLTKARVAELARVVDDADCVYRWAPVQSSTGKAAHKAVFVDVRAASKASRASTLLKSSVHVVDVGVDEILSAVAKPKTRDARRAWGFLLGDTFVDTQTLLSFPVAASKRSRKRAAFAYRAVKWAALRPPSQKRAHAATPVDFCYVEYAGRCKPHAAGSVVGFCIQESLARDREVPSLEDAYGIRRGAFLRTGLIVTRTHQSNILKVTSICQILHPPAPPTPLSALDAAQSSVIQQDEPLLLEYVAGVHRLKGLLERQRMGKLQYLDEWDWVPSADRKACAVCLRGFYFHRKHHCHTCGEVVCANCAPLRELDEPLLGRTDGPAATHKLRVCSLCMAQAGSTGPSDDMSGDVSEDEDAATTTTSNGGTDTYVRGLRYPPGYHRRRPQPMLSVDPRGRRSASERSSNASDRSDALARKKEALDKLVDHIRQIRDTLDEAISEVDEERASLDVVNGQPARHRGRGRAFVDDRDADHDEDEEVDPHSDDEQYDDIYERILQIRETLDRSGEFDAVLAAVGGRDSTVDGSRPSSGLDESFLGQSEDELADSAELEFNLTMSSHESISMLSGGSFASLSSQSMSSVGEDESVDGDYETQDAGEPREVSHGETHGDRPHVHYADSDDDNLKLQKALLWARQSDPLATDVGDPSNVSKKLPADEPKASSPIPVVTVSKNRGIERLAMKIGRLQQRLEAAAARVDEDHPQPEADPDEDPTKDGTADGTADGTDVSSGRGSDASSRSRVPPELVADLRGVMNSSELTRPPVRRASSPVDGGRPRGPPPPVPSTAPFADAGRPPSPPEAAPVAGTTIYVFDDAKVNKLQPRWVPARRAGATTAVVDEDATVDVADAADGRVDAVDESEELRELMEGLAAARPSRSRCSSGQSSGAPPTEKFDF